MDTLGNFTDNFTGNVTSNFTGDFNSTKVGLDPTPMSTKEIVLLVLYVLLCSTPIIVFPLIHIVWRCCGWRTGCPERVPPVTPEPGPSQQQEVQETPEQQQQPSSSSAQNCDRPENEDRTENGDQAEKEDQTSPLMASPPMSSPPINIQAPAPVAPAQEEGSDSLSDSTTNLLKGNGYNH